MSRERRVVEEGRGEKELEEEQKTSERAQSKKRERDSLLDTRAHRLLYISVKRCVVRNNLSRALPRYPRTSSSTCTWIDRILPNAISSHIGDRVASLIRKALSYRGEICQNRTTLRVSHHPFATSGNLFRSNFILFTFSFVRVSFQNAPPPPSTLTHPLERKKNRTATSVPNISKIFSLLEEGTSLNETEEINSYVISHVPLHSRNYFPSIRKTRAMTNR